MAFSVAPPDPEGGGYRLQVATCCVDQKGGPLGPPIVKGNNMHPSSMLLQMCPMECP